jgi:acetyl esterase/lipase
MNRRFSWSALALLALSPAIAQEAPLERSQDPRAAEFFAMVKRHVQDPRREPAPGAIERREDLVTGKRSDGSPLHIDLALPASRGSAGPRPVVLLLHGGLPDEIPIRPSDWQAYRDWGAILADAGFATVMFDHSLGFPKRRLEVASAEITTVLDWVASNATELRLSTDRVHAVSFSAGGLLLPELARGGRFASFVLFYPLLGVPTGGPDAQAMSVEERAPLAFASGLRALTAKRRPLLILRAGADAVPACSPSSIPPCPRLWRAISTSN